MSDGITLIDWLDAENFGRNDILIIRKTTHDQWGGQPTYYEPPEGEHEPYEEEDPQAWRTEPITKAQEATIAGLKIAIGGAFWPWSGTSAPEIEEEFLRVCEREGVSHLNQEEAAGLIEALGKDVAEAHEGMTIQQLVETMGMPWPIAIVVMGAGGGLAYKKSGMLTEAGLPARAILPKIGRFGGESYKQLSSALRRERFGDPQVVQALFEYWEERGEGKPFKTPAFKWTGETAKQFRLRVAAEAAAKKAAGTEPTTPYVAKGFKPKVTTKFDPKTGKYIPTKPIRVTVTKPSTPMTGAALTQQRASKIPSGHRIIKYTPPKPSQFAFEKPGATGYFKRTSYPRPTTVKWTPKYGAPTRGGLRTAHEAKIYRELIEQLSGKAKPTRTAEAKAIEKELEALLKGKPITKTSTTLKLPTGRAPRIGTSGYTSVVPQPSTGRIPAWAYELGASPAVMYGAIPAGIAAGVLGAGQLATMPIREKYFPGYKPEGVTKLIAPLPMVGMPSTMQAGMAMGERDPFGKPLKEAYGKYQEFMENLVPYEPKPVEPRMYYGTTPEELQAYKKEHEMIMPRIEKWAASIPSWLGTQAEAVGSFMPSWLPQGAWLPKGKWW